MPRHYDRPTPESEPEAADDAAAPKSSQAAMDLAMLVATLAGGTVANHGGSLPPDVAARLVESAETLINAAKAHLAKPKPDPTGEDTTA